MLDITELLNRPETEPMNDAELDHVENFAKAGLIDLTMAIKTMLEEHLASPDKLTREQITSAQYYFDLPAPMSTGQIHDAATLLEAHC